MTLIHSQRAFGPFVLSVEDIRPHLLNSKLKESELIKLIDDMSMKFTVKRDKIQDYIINENAVSAYSAFYLPTNIPKLHFLLSKLKNETLDDIIKRPFIDFGCGPGTFSLAMSLLFEKIHQKSWQLIHLVSCSSKLRKFLLDFSNCQFSDYK